MRGAAASAHTSQRRPPSATRRAQKDASGQLTAGPRAAPASRRPSARRARSAGAPARAAARRPRRRGCARSRSRSTSRRRGSPSIGPVGDHAPVGQQHDALGELGGELGVVGRDQDRLPASARTLSRSASASFAARSMPRVGSSSASTAGGSPPPPARSPAPGAGARRRRGRAGGARRAPSSPTAAAPPPAPPRRRARGGSSRRGSAAAARRARRARRSLASARSRPAAWRSSVDLPAPFRPISATLSPGADAQVDAAQDRRPVVQLVPHAAKLERGAAPRAPARTAARTGAAAGARRRGAARRVGAGGAVAAAARAREASREPA